MSNDSTAGPIISPPMTALPIRSSMEDPNMLKTVDMKIIASCQWWRSRVGISGSPGLPTERQDRWDYGIVFQVLPAGGVDGSLPQHLT